MIKRVRLKAKEPKASGTKPAAERERVRLNDRNESASNTDDYKVGKNRPPLHTQFKKGDGRQRPGRPKGSKNLRTIIMEAVNDPVSVIVEGQSRKITKLQATAMQLATRAATGNDKAIAKLLDWVDEIEARAEAARPSEYAFSDVDKKVIQEVYQRLRPYDERVND